MLQEKSHNIPFLFEASIPIKVFHNYPNLKRGRAHHQSIRLGASNVVILLLNGEIYVLGFYLGLSWHSVLKWDTDLRAFTLSGEAGSCAQGVLHLYGGRGAPSHSGRKLYGGQDPWRRGLKGHEVEQVLAGPCITKCHLRRRAEGSFVKTKPGNIWRSGQSVYSNLGVVLPLSVCKERYLVVPLGQSGDINIL